MKSDYRNGTSLERYVVSQVLLLSRLHVGLTQQELARRVGVSQLLVSKAEWAALGQPSFDFVATLLPGLECDPALFYLRVVTALGWVLGTGLTAPAKDAPLKVQRMFLADLRWMVEQSKGSRPELWQ